MKLERIRLKTFSLFDKLELNFCPGVNLIIGDNGTGKTSLLDAISICLNDYLETFDLRKDMVLKNYVKRGGGVFLVEYMFSYGKERFYNSKTYSISADKQSGRFFSGDNPFRTKNPFEGGQYPIISYQSLTYGNNYHNYKDREYKRLNAYVGCLNGGSRFAYAKKWYHEKKFVSDDYGEAQKYENIIKKFIRGMTDEDIELSSSMTVNSQINTKKNPSAQKSLEQVRTDLESAMKRALETGKSSNYAEFYHEYCSDEFLRRAKLKLYHEILVKKGEGEFVPLSRESSGYRAIMEMIMDIAYKAVVLNPEMEQPELAEGIIMIDEIDLHLHPRWQWRVLKVISETFPNIQFIVTTHSPMILSSCKECRLITLHYNDRNDEQPALDPNALYGKPISSILEHIFGSSSTTPDLNNMNKRFHGFIDDGNYEAAETVLNEMTKAYGKSNEIVQSAQLLFTLNAPLSAERICGKPTEDELFDLDDELFDFEDDDNAVLT